MSEGDKKTPEGLYRYTDYNSSSIITALCSFIIQIRSMRRVLVEDEAITVNIQKEIQRAHENQLSATDAYQSMGIFWSTVHIRRETTFFPSHMRYLYTDGCVGMSNDDIDELREYLDEVSALNSGKILIVP